jgi:hypothetical protein
LRPCRNRFARILLPLGILSLLSGCINSPGGIAPSNVPMDGRTYSVLGETSATDSSIWILGFIPVTGSNKIRDALSDAMRKKDADAMINITVESYAQYWILFVRYVTRVDGTAVRFN